MQIYLVGGAVRDKLLGIENSDRDFVVVGSTPEEMLRQGFTQVGKDFPVFLHSKTHEEYALARTERKKGVGYSGFICDYAKNISLKEDLIRRDLTINAIAMDEKGNIIDPFMGQEDLKRKILRHISPAFEEDPLRVLRVARFYAKFYHLGFTVADETIALMRKISRSGELEALTPERIFIELKKALTTDSPERFILMLRKVEALHTVLPELDRLFGVPGPENWHPEIDSGIHTCMTLKTICKYTKDPVIRFAMLCHDLGKGETPITMWPCHHYHDLLGEKPLRSLAQRLRIPANYFQLALIVVLNHSTMHQLYKQGALGIVKLVGKLDGWRKPYNVKAYALCCKCDFLGRMGFENKTFNRYEYFLEIYEICRRVKAEPFIQQGYRGAAISEQILKKRVELTENYCAQLSSEELSDAPTRP